MFEDVGFYSLETQANKCHLLLVVTTFCTFCGPGTAVGALSISEQPCQLAPMNPSCQQRLKGVSLA